MARKQQMLSFLIGYRDELPWFGKLFDIMSVNKISIIVSRNKSYQGYESPSLWNPCTPTTLVTLISGQGESSRALRRI